MKGWNLCIAYEFKNRGTPKGWQYQKSYDRI